MKCAIIYFSQTGGTEKVAMAIQKGIKQAAGHCDIFKIKDANPRRLYEYDLIGLGCPVFHLEEPGNVRAFIQDMRFVGGKQAFVFSTHGTQPEYLFPSLIPRLKSRGLIVIGMSDWYGDTPVSHIRPYPTAGHPDAIDLREAEEFGRKIVDTSRRISAGETGLIPPVPPPPPKPESKIPEIKGVKNERAKGKADYPTISSMVKFHKEKCNYPNCRLCMDNCPMDGIDLSVSPPVICNPCISCEFCTKICPTGAIEVDDYLKAFNIEAIPKIMPIFMMPLEKAEKEGRFRFAIAKDKIGSLSNLPLKHPCWVIGKGEQ